MKQFEEEMIQINEEREESRIIYCTLVYEDENV